MLRTLSSKLKTLKSQAEVPSLKLFEKLPVGELFSDLATPVAYVGLKPPVVIVMLDVIKALQKPAMAPGLDSIRGLGGLGVLRG